MTIPTTVVSEQEGNAAREAQLVKEEQLTHAPDALVAERRRLPMMWVRRHDEYTPRELAGGHS